MESETSGDELRAKLYRSFKDRGVLDSLKVSKNKVLCRTTVYGLPSTSPTCGPGWPQSCSEEEEGAAIVLRGAPARFLPRRSRREGGRGGGGRVLRSLSRWLTAWLRGTSRRLAMNTPSLCSCQRLASPWNRCVYTRVCIIMYRRLVCTA